MTAIVKCMLNRSHPLDHLSLLVGFQDWESFQEALHGEVSADENYNKKEVHS